MDPPRHVGPVAAVRNMVNKPGNHDASCSAAFAVGVWVVPDVTCEVRFIAGAVELVLVAIFVDRR